MASNTSEVAKLIVPAATWVTVKRVITAYGASSGEDPSGGEIAGLGGLQRTVVSACNKFLRSAGIVQPDRNKLTELGDQLSTAWSIENQPMAQEALQKIVASSPPLAQLANMVRARGSMSTELLRGQIIVAAGLNKDSFVMPYVKTILDMLDESRLIQVTDDTVTFGRTGGGEERKAEDSKRLVRGGGENREDRKESEGSRTPIPLGPDRLAYLELPKNWDNKELPKLLKMLELIFGGDG